MWLTARLFRPRLSCTVQGIAQPSRFSNYSSTIWVTRRGGTLTPINTEQAVSNTA
ncbi:hypothetical protein T12_10124 [Trichinella patagoniensis]|uniref:Uncharacterized protein n=1 Tax=Trichinella patagoniensis TaxID=990121 RepID=A0A0V0YS72_9BILA|nr:hypothetical protein T12_10124 [Trichinella patagoniensis]